MLYGSLMLLGSSWKWLSRIYCAVSILSYEGFLIKLFTHIERKPLVPINYVKLGMRSPKLFKHYLILESNARILELYKQEEYLLFTSN